MVNGGVTEGSVTQTSVARWCTRTSRFGDFVDILIDLPPLRFQCGVHAHTTDRRSVLWNPKRGKLAKWIALRGGSLPCMFEETT